MKKNIFLPLAATGCESESGSDSRREASITVSPAEAAMEAGQTMVFSAYGGWDYKWKLSDDHLGTLSKTEGSRVTYTMTSAEGTQTITVTGVPDGGPSGTLCQAKVTIEPSERARETQAARREAEKKAKEAEQATATGDTFSN